ncbi:MAG TPA: energy transducer TonB [Terriglobia bacterium]
MRNTQPVRKGGVIQAANLIQQIKPSYPLLARQARVQGVVVMEAEISKDGSVQSLRVISGHPLLNQAALDAVRQWKYRPTLLNGEPVEVLTTITVTFTLQ